MRERTRPLAACGGRGIGQLWRERRRNSSRVDFEIWEGRMCRASGAWVFAVLYPALTGWAQFCRASGAAVWTGGVQRGIAVP
jgi:hypothetical protein